ncbi:MAG: hypothetical protein JW746_06405 [Candidatus Krumholzibacteriota bacterium]|nr:hypothetical protein [Candidatus Krumholzibacteriota bacterium]
MVCFPVTPGRQRWFPPAVAEERRPMIIDGKDPTGAESGFVAPAVKFGTFLGVFTPSTLTILGLIMYLRFGWVVGNLGLPLTLLVVLMASAITFITG